MTRLTREEVEGARIHTKFSEYDLSELDLIYLNLSYKDFSNTDLHGTDFTNSRLSSCDFTNADLTGANFTGADISGADLTGAKLTFVIGLATKAQEMAEAQRILQLLQQPENKLIMDEWHTCSTAHCLAGWSCPENYDPSTEAGRKMPTLTKYFFEHNNEEAFDALVRVASGEESIWNRMEVV
jgi:hypothetical protein